MCTMMVCMSCKFSLGYLSTTQKTKRGDLGRINISVFVAFIIHYINFSGVSRRRKVGGGGPQTFFPKSEKQKKKKKKKRSQRRKRPNDIYQCFHNKRVDDIYVINA